MSHSSPASPPSSASSSCSAPSRVKRTTPGVASSTTSPSTSGTRIVRGVVAGSNVARTAHDGSTGQCGMPSNELLAGDAVSQVRTANRSRRGPRRMTFIWKRSTSSSVGGTSSLLSLSATMRTASAGRPS